MGNYPRSREKVQTNYSSLKQIVLRNAKHLKNTLICLCFFLREKVDRIVFVPAKLCFTRTGCGQTLQTSRDRETGANVSNFKGRQSGRPWWLSGGESAANTGRGDTGSIPHPTEQLSLWATTTLEPRSLTCRAHVPTAPAQQQEASQ